MINKMFKSIIDQDRAAVVICDLKHVIVYMNPAATINYEKRGGLSLVGQSIFDCHNEESKRIIEKVIDWFKASKNHNMIYTFYNEKQNKDVYMVALRDEADELIGYYEKHEYRNIETANKYDFDNPVK